MTILPRVDRDSIERRDFPVGRRGYDQAAVDAHLRHVADQMESLRDRPPAAPSSLAAGTSEQVRAILEAAEAGAAELRAGAGEQAARVEEAANDMLGQLGRLEDELGGLLESLRRSNERLNEGLARLRQASAPAPEQEEDFAAAAPAPESGDEAGARLTALNMALGGTPREETARYLAEHFSLPDADALLDDVYERAGR